MTFLAAFFLIVLASRQIGVQFRRGRLPLITGFLLTGMLAGPYLLGLLTDQMVRQLRFVDQIALGFIALAAGAEFDLAVMRKRLRVIASVASGLVVVTFVLGSLAFYLLSAFIPAFSSLPSLGRVAVAMLAGSILIARSPSSAIAIVNELRAKGPFTRMALGVTIIMDVVVIVWFSGTSAFANAALTSAGFSPGFLPLLLGELLVSLVVGVALAGLLALLFGTRMHPSLKTGLLLAAGYAIYPLSAWFRAWTHEVLPFEVLIEPLFICMVAGFALTNYTRHHDELARVLASAGPAVYVVFFTLAGASLQLDQLLGMWPIAVGLFAARLFSIAIGSFAGGVLSRAPAQHNRLGWMAFVTQAGVGLGLAKEVALEFPEWGAAFATLLISVIVINQVVGPPLLKWAIHRVDEAHERAPSGAVTTGRALIFGLESQSLALARQLKAHGWSAVIASREARQRDAEEIAATDVEIVPIQDIDLETLHALDAHQATAIVTLLSDDENYAICRMAYEHFGTENLVVRLDDRSHWQRFHDLGALIVDPPNAIVSLLDHMVRSPTAASLLLGTDERQDVLDLTVRNRDLEGLPLRDLHLPLDTLIVSIRRDGETLSSHGFTRLKRGDRVTALGSPESLRTVLRLFDG